MENKEIIDFQISNPIQTKPYQTAFKWGLILFFSNIILTLVPFYINGEKLKGDNSTLNYGFFLLYLAVVSVIITFSIKEYRDQLNNGFISFKKGFGSGFLTGLIACLLGIVFTFIYYSYIVDMSSEISSQTDELIKKLKEKNLSDEQIAQSIKMTSFFFKIPILVTMGFLIGLFINTIIALISAAILKKEVKYV